MKIYPIKITVTTMSLCLMMSVMGYSQEIVRWSPQSEPARAELSAPEEADGYQAEGDLDFSTFDKTSDSDAEEAWRKRTRYLKGFVMRAEQLYRNGQYQQALQQLNAVFIHEPYNESAQALKAKIERAVIKEQGRRNQKTYKSSSAEQAMIKRDVRKIKQLYRARQYDEAIDLCKDVLFLDPDNRTASKYFRKSESKKRKQLKAQRAKELKQTSADVGRSRAGNGAVDREQTPMIDVQPTMVASPVTATIDEPAVVAPASMPSALSKEEAQEAAMRALLGGLTDDVPQTQTESSVHMFEQTIVAEPSVESKITPAVVPESDEDKPEITIFDIEEMATSSVDTETIHIQLADAKKALRQKNYDRAIVLYAEVLKSDPQNKTAKRGLKKAQKKQAKVLSRKRKAEARAAKQKRAALGSRERETVQKTATLESGERETVVVPGATRKKKGFFTGLFPKKKPMTPQQKQAVEVAAEAKRLYKERSYEAAISLYEDALALDPKNRTAAYGIDRAREKLILRGHDEYMENREKQKKDTKEKIEFYKSIAQKQQAKGEYASAKVMIQKALLLEPNNGELIQMKEDNDAFFREDLSAHKQVAGVAPKDSDQIAGEAGTYINRGVKEYLLGNNEKAIEYFNKVLEIDPNDQKAHASIVRIKQEMSRA